MGVGNFEESKRGVFAAFDMRLIWLIYYKIVVRRTKLIKLISKFDVLQKQLRLQSNKAICGLRPQALSSRFPAESP